MSLLHLAAAAIAPGNRTTAILESVDLTVAPGDRLALVGANGSGKSTLLAVLAGDQPLLHGTRTTAAGARIAASSSVVLSLDASVEAVLLSHRPAELAALRRLRADPADPFAIGAWDDLDGWTIEARLEESRVALGIDRPLEAAVGELSGGQRRRVAIAAALRADADVLLLDEPSDDLDARAVAWLERELARTDAAVVMASHDRELLRRWPTRIARLDPHARKVSVARGGLDELEALERTRADAAQREYDGAMRRAEAAERAAQARAAQAMTMHRVDLNDGRHSKQEKAYYNERAGGLANKARVLRARAEREQVERPHAPRRVGRIAVEVDGAARGGSDIVLSTRDLIVGYDGAAVAGPIDLSVARGTRTALLGANGSGKSTLLRTLQGALPPIRGELHVGGASHMGALAQHVPTDLLGLTALELVASLDGGAPRQERTRTMLGSLLLRGRELQATLGELSEGSRRKVLLALLLTGGADLLLLDEPGNHLDLDSRDALADALAASAATIVFVSHDRALVDRIASQRYELRPGHGSCYVARHD